MPETFEDKVRAKLATGEEDFDVKVTVDFDGKLKIQLNPSDKMASGLGLVFGLVGNKVVEYEEPDTSEAPRGVEDPQTEEEAE